MKHTDDIPIAGFDLNDESDAEFIDTTDADYTCGRGSPSGEWGCTRQAGHNGMHMAGNDDVILAAW